MNLAASKVCLLLPNVVAVVARPTLDHHGDASHSQRSSMLLTTRLRSSAAVTSMRGTPALRGPRVKNYLGFSVRSTSSVSSAFGLFLHWLSFLMCFEFVVHDASQYNITHLGV
jgi:hypothetical protein